MVAGAGAMTLVAAYVEADALQTLLWIVAISNLVHLLMVLGEATLTHSTAHAHLAAHEMIRGRYSRFFWVGMLLTTVSVAAPWIGVAAGPAALLGLLAFEHAYVQAGQSVPLA